MASSSHLKERPKTRTPKKGASMKGKDISSVSQKGKGKPSKVRYESESENTEEEYEEETSSIEEQDQKSTSTSNESESESDSYEDEEKGQYDEDDSDEGDEEEEEEDNLAVLNRWGKDKNMYYNADTTDLEIGQDFDDAEEEEKIARQMQQSMYDKIDESDFMLLDSHDNNNKNKSKKKNSTSKKRMEKDKEEDEELSLMNKNDLMKLDRKQALNMISKTEKLERLLAESPELLLLVEDMKTKIHELREKIMPLLDMLRKVSSSTVVVHFSFFFYFIS